MPAIRSSTIATSGWSRRTTPSLQREPSGAGQAEPEVVVADHLVARRPVDVDATDVRQEHPRLAGHVGAHVPRVGGGVERDVGAVVDVLHPARLRRLGGLDRGVAVLAQVVEAVGDPVDVLLDRHHHVRQHRRAARAGDGEEVREADRGESEIGGGAVRPLLLQRHAVASGDVDRDEGAGHRVEPGGVHDGVELERLVDGVDAGLGDRRDRVLAQVDEPDVRQVVGGEVVGVETRPLGGEGVVGRAQRLGRRRDRPRSIGSCPG